MCERKRILLLGKSGRLDAMAEAIHRSPRLDSLYILSEVTNRGLWSHACHVELGDSADPETVLNYARRVKPDFAVIGPEEPLEAGIVDELAKIGIPSVGPTQELAKIETSKSFARQLMAVSGIPGNPEYRIFAELSGIRSFFHALGEFVVKPDGLTGGKGVKVFGEHLHTFDQAFTYCEEILEAGDRVVVEEKLVGEEFTYQSFSDGRTVRHMIPVQDHKRLCEGDMGPNTGGMGSYSCEDHLLPFLSRADLELAGQINEAVIHALHRQTKQEYKGILYGGFMLTPRGLRVIEFNARFGDPEALNVLPLLETDFVDVCEAIIDGTLDQLDVRFARRATVCKYIVPTGYPLSPLRGEALEITDPTTDRLRIYYGAVQDEADGTMTMTGSRAVGFVGIGSNLAEAEQLAETAIGHVKGNVFHRRDIGTEPLVVSRVDHMARLRVRGNTPERRLATAS